MDDLSGHKVYVDYEGYKEAVYLHALLVDDVYYGTGKHTERDVFCRWNNERQRWDPVPFERILEHYELDFTEIKEDQCAPSTSRSQTTSSPSATVSRSTCTSSARSATARLTPTVAPTR